MWLEVNLKTGECVSHECACLHCKAGENLELGAHHAADCPKYRSPYVGPDADYWASKLRGKFAEWRAIAAREGR